jgi:hypothetical protein
VEEVAQIKGYEDVFTFRALAINQPVDGLLPVDTTEPVALVISYLRKGRNGNLTTIHATAWTGIRCRAVADGQF